MKDNDDFEGIFDTSLINTPIQWTSSFTVNAQVQEYSGMWGGVALDKKQKYIPIVPEGYKLVKDDDYIIKIGDLFYLSIWGEGMPFDKIISANGIAGLNLRRYRERFATYNPLLAAKPLAKPRFECGKPFPYGY